MRYSSVEYPSVLTFKGTSLLGLVKSVQNPGARFESRDRLGSVKTKDKD